MKTLCKIMFSLNIIVQGCSTVHNSEYPDQFSSSNDTIILRTVKVKGSGLFSLGAGTLTFRDTTELFEYPVTYPQDISNLKGIQMTTDFRSAEVDYIDIITGRKENKDIFIVDQNDNKDFTDDSVRVFKKMDWRSSENSIKCKYYISSGEEIDSDSSWVKIGTQNGRILYGRDEHLAVDFHIDNVPYKIGIIDQVLTLAFNYGANPEIAILAKNSECRDNLVRHDFIKLDEYLNFDGTYYRFDSITNDGKYITLIKEPNFESQIGTQVGMLAPEFNCVTVDGDTIRSSDLKHRSVLLANSCGCGGDKLSTESFYNIMNTFGKRIYALRLDSGLKKGLEGWNIDTEHEYNKDIYEKYRKEYCSRVAYFIGTNKRILEKFDITNWESILMNQTYD